MLRMSIYESLEVANEWLSDVGANLGLLGLGLETDAISRLAPIW